MVIFTRIGAESYGACVCAVLLLFEQVVCEGFEFRYVSLVHP